MTDDELTAIEARANAATVGPWGHEYEGVHKGTGREYFSVCKGHGTGEHVCVADVTSNEHDAGFIEMARTDVPKLVREVRALRAERDALRAQLDDFATHGTRADLNPTMRVLPQTDGERRIVEWFYKYLRQLDTFVKTSATSVLIKAGARP